MDSQNDRSIADVVRDIVADLQELIRSEFELAKTEIREEASKAAKSGALFAIGAVLGLYAVGFLLLTILYALEIALAPWLAALIVTAMLLTLAALILVAGRKRMRQVRVPEKTVRTVKENVRWAKQQVTERNASTRSASI